jgi:2-oxo-4-hydroxy-4-carboxy--5-ureidoimidazoline (OHCU) decarboxylase
MSVLDNLDIDSCFDLIRLRAYIRILQNENARLRADTGVARHKAKKSDALRVIRAYPKMASSCQAKLAKCSTRYINQLKKDLK